MQLEFYGWAGEVTGSCHIVTVGGRRLLLDCGMIQGGASPDQRNRAEFPFDATRIDAVILSHAHIDHSGRLPLLRRRGFRGPIYANPACRDLMRINNSVRPCLGTIYIFHGQNRSLLLLIQFHHLL